MTATPLTPSLAESLLQFPCDFPIKVMGQATHDDLFPLVLAIVQRHAPDYAPEAHNFKTRASQNARYWALTLTIQATSRAQLDAIYQDLSRCPAVLMAL